MGRVTTELTLFNLHDLFDAQVGRLQVSNIRQVHISDALVDTGATTLCLTPGIIQQLGLRQRGEKTTRTASGTAKLKSFEAVRLEIMGRDATVDPIEVPEGTPVLIGQIPLEMMDWVVDLRNHKLIGNPAHNGEHIIEIY